MTALAVFCTILLFWYLYNKQKDDPTLKAQKDAPQDCPFVCGFYDTSSEDE